MKKLVLLFGIAIAAMSSEASYLLWWNITGDEAGLDAVTSYAKNELGLTYEQIQVQVVEKDATGKTTVIDSLGFVDEWYTNPGQNVKISDLAGSGYSYYIEMISMNNPSVQVGVARYNTRYDDLVTAGSITPDSMTDVPAAAVWHGGQLGYKAAPEPTSALLMLLGVAGLALRRKQRKA